MQHSVQCSYISLHTGHIGRGPSAGRFKLASLFPFSSESLFHHFYSYSVSSRACLAGDLVIALAAIVFNDHSDFGVPVRSFAATGAGCGTVIISCWRF